MCAGGGGGGKEATLAPHSCRFVDLWSHASDKGVSVWLINFDLLNKTMYTSKQFRLGYCTQSGVGLRKRGREPQQRLRWKSGACHSVSFRLRMRTLKESGGGLDYGVVDGGGEG